MNARKDKRYYNSIVRCNIRDLPDIFNVDIWIKILYIGASNLVFIDLDGNPYKINIPVRRGWNDLQVDDEVTVRRTLSYGAGQNKGIVYGVLNILRVKTAEEDTTDKVEPKSNKILKHLQQLIEEAKIIAITKRQIILDLIPDLVVDKELITDDLIDNIVAYIEEEYKEVETLALDEEEEVFFNKLLDKKIARKLTSFLELVEK
ncbi:hypothetical protein J7J63_05050 [Candidatus Bipolaricaulota bacterium]|nr:hypothetical protein [Candidatus Bipolaricaulota bacterium]